MVIYYSYNFLFCTFLVFLLFPKLVTESFILLYFFHKTMFYLLEIVFFAFLLNKFLLFPLPFPFLKNLKELQLFNNKMNCNANYKINTTVYITPFILKYLSLSLSLPHLQITLMLLILLALNISLYISYYINMDIVLHFFRKIIKIRKFSIDMILLSICLTHSLYSNNFMNTVNDLYIVF